ncbi:unnamed protein product [Rotaria sp. Silwood1]|nr:unnamed protein product [Rotaria sp. Silwood1]CAF3334811.1 unnamed protein product [Rotaria sp. Silwood1]CAF3360368.1 unnamed protein product [Rotaria sp. Silwood1]CAF4882476.1 unnamed protein product [Rotaria sp. Silwood1]CAF4996562.1 unnamed protein product [Rotaria sp. Silwood1]
MFFVCFILSSICISKVNGWGTTGHSLVAKLAQTRLTKESEKFVRDYLPWYTTGDLSMLASWPDTIVSPNTNPVDYLNWLWSKELHYVNTPDWICNYDRNRDCNWTSRQRCVDGTIRNYTKQLADINQDNIRRQEALKFLVHFIGDVHQPLHAGFVGDKGGNFIRGYFFDKSTNLHALWDTLMIERRISLDFQNDQNKYYNYLLNLLQTTYTSNISQWSKCPPDEQSHYLACSTVWINENIELNCAYIYRDEDDKPMNTSHEFHLGQMYYNTRIGILEQRLIQSSVRLSGVINKIVELQKREHHRKKHNKLYSEEMLIILVMFIAAFVTFIGCICYLVRRTFTQQSVVETSAKYHSLNDINK